MDIKRVRKLKPTKPVAVKEVSKEPVKEPVFKDPETVAAADAQTQQFSPVEHKKPSKNPLAGLQQKWGKMNGKQRSLLLAIIILLLAAVGFGLYKTFKKAPPPAPAPVAQEEPKPVEPPKPTTEASRLTGVQISPELNKRGVTAVMIENSVDARPQAGLKDAGVVFEAIAEGGITRFVALFQEAQPDYIGPVRSARPYYIDWMMGFDAAYAHAGGSGEALEMISSLGVKDLPHNDSAFWRVNNRYAPHNLYTASDKLDAYRAARGYGGSEFTPLLRAEEKPVTPATVTSIDMNPSSGLYAVHYDYDAASNSYKRFLAGPPHNDEKLASQLTPKVVVALIVPYGIHPDRIHSVYTTIGSGQAFIFQNGVMIQATWTKLDRKSQITFTDAAGKPVGLNPGQTWFTALGGTDRLGYK